MEAGFREQVESLFGMAISDEEFERALGYAKRKQAHIFQLTGRKEVMEDWYLAKLTEEQARSNALSDFSMDLCRTLYEMEKEHSFRKEQSALQAIPIVNVSAL